MEALLLVEALCHRGWVDAERAAPTPQRRPEVASEVISRLGDARADGEPVPWRYEECHRTIRLRSAFPTPSAVGCPTGSASCFVLMVERP